MTSLIYLDNSTTSRPSERVISSMMPFWTSFWGNPMTPHQKGQELYPFLAEFYKTLYSFIGAKDNEQIILTSSGTEAINHVIFSAYRDITIPTGKNQFLTSKADEAASIMTIGRLESFGCLGKMIEVNNQGVVTAETLADSLSTRTALVSLSWANGLTGTIQPITEIADLCEKRGIPLHIDATHVLGKLYYELKDIGASYLTCNGDQLHGPKGTGLLYIKEGITCSPFIFGSADQNGMRAGGLNIPALAGLATAAKEALECRDLMCTEIARLRNHLENGILKGYPQAQICFKNQERLPHCTTIIFPEIANEALLFTLNRNGICASIGGGNFQQLAQMLTLSGIDKKLAQSAISFSLSRYTTEEEIDRAIKIVVDCAHHLARFFPHGLKKDQ